MNDDVKNDELRDVFDALELFLDNVNRLREVNVDDTRVQIKARIGGGNRSDYEESVEELRVSPYYVEDHDKATDDTYLIATYTTPYELRETNWFRDQLAQRDGEWEYPYCVWRWGDT